MIIMLHRLICREFFMEAEARVADGVRRWANSNGIAKKVGIGMSNRGKED